MVEQMGLDAEVTQGAEEELDVAYDATTVLLECNVVAADAT